MMDQVLDVFFKRCYTCTVVVAGGEELHRPFHDTQAAQLCVQEARRRESKDILFQDVDGGLDMLITDSVLRELDQPLYFDTPGLVRRRLSFADSAGAAGLDTFAHDVPMPVHSCTPETASDDALTSWLQGSEESPVSELSPVVAEGLQRPTLAWRLGLTTPQSTESEDYSRRSSISTQESYKLSPVPVERAEDDWSLHMTLPAAWKVAHQLAVLRDQSLPPPLPLTLPAKEDLDADFYDGFVPSGSGSTRLHRPPLLGHLGLQESPEAKRPRPSLQRQPVMLVGI
mmetsp:Transcript_34473/g.78661  ORF Transcript_34473/g.78661 Transcript_34473/m.78661 type:complete len:285 (+) Transcript_34473:103-957(+)